MKNAIQFTKTLFLTLLIITYSCSKDDDPIVINLQNLEVTIDENPTVGQVIGTIESDNNASLIFSITSQTPNGALEINENTGELTVADATLFDFETNPTITATIAADKAQNTATVTISLEDKHEVGEYKFGGVIFWVNTSGDQGLVCAVSDQSLGIRWYNGTNVSTGATALEIGTGQVNTTAIVNVQGVGSYAAQICNDLSLNNYDDWFLPSIGELQEIYNNKEIINTTCLQNSGTALEETAYWSSAYWSSTESSNDSARILRFSDGYNSPQGFGKGINNLNVRAVRAWTDF